MYNNDSSLAWVHQFITINVRLMIGIVNDAEIMVPLKSRFEVILSFASYRIIILDSDLSENCEDRQ